MRALFLTFVALILLLLTTVGVSFLSLGIGNLLLNLAIAAAKAALILAVFMRLKSSNALIHIIAFSGLVWLTIMFWLTFSDYLSRSV